MSTPTPLTHPRAPLQTEQFYPFAVEIKTQTGELVAGPFVCAYDAATGREAGVFEDEAPTDDKILIPSWQPGIKAKMLAVVDLNGTKKRFEIVDVVPQGNPLSQTLLIVTPT